MRDIAKRFPENPLLMPKDLQACNSDIQIISLLNPGAFRFKDKVHLLVRVAEWISQEGGVIFFPVVNALGEVEDITYTAVSENGVGVELIRIIIHPPHPSS